jgi:SAM-dependent methyltransferase
VSQDGAFCILCGRPGGLRYVKEPAHYWECPACRLLYQHPLPDAAAMREFADAEYSSGVYREYVAARELKDRTFRDRLASIPGGGQRLLDVGCACGYLIDVALEAGYDAYGVEFPAAAAAQASLPARARIVVGSVEAMLRQRLGEFDVITAFDIIEHTRDPVGFLGDLRDLLRPGGTLLLTTPDVHHPLRWMMGARWPMFQPLQHTFLFSRLGMHMALERAGLALTRIEGATKRLTLEYLASQIEGHNPRIWRLYRALSRLTPPKIRRQPVNVNIGEMLVVARKPA